METKTITKKLNSIQVNLCATKDLYNNFGNYSYRSTESILQALKPFLEETETVLTITDDVIVISDRIYIKATATLSDGVESISVSAFAREPLSKKGVDESQITGAASSYARKYALCGLFAIDDNKDADATNTHGREHDLNVEEICKSLDEASSLTSLQSIARSAWDIATKQQQEKILESFNRNSSRFNNDVN